jgi:hypothetical protein
MKSLAAFVLFFGISFTAHADVFDRINECERTGGGSCVYNILRELARTTSNPGAIPLTGSYKKISGSTDLCEDQFLEPVIVQGVLSQVKMGWCGSRYNITYDCLANRCGANGVVIEILERNKYYFTNEANSSGTFAMQTVEGFEGVAAGSSK